MPRADVTECGAGVGSEQGFDVRGHDRICDGDSITASTTGAAVPGVEGEAVAAEVLCADYDGFAVYHGCFDMPIGVAIVGGLPELGVAIFIVISGLVILGSASVEAGGPDKSDEWCQDHPDNPQCQPESEQNPGQTKKDDQQQSDDDCNGSNPGATCSNGDANGKPNNDDDRQRRP